MQLYWFIGEGYWNGIDQSQVRNWDFMDPCFVKKDLFGKISYLHNIFQYKVFIFNMCLIFIEHIYLNK